VIGTGGGVLMSPAAEFGEGEDDDLIGFTDRFHFSLEGQNGVAEALKELLVGLGLFGVGVEATSREVNDACVRRCRDELGDLLKAVTEGVVGVFLGWGVALELAA